MKSTSMPPHQNMFVSTRTLKASIFRPPRKQQVNSNPYTEFKSISISIIKSSEFHCHDTKTKLISIPELKPILFRPPHQNQVNSDPILKSRQVQSPALKSSQYRCSPLNQAICGPHPNTESISTTPAHTKTKSVDHHT